MSVPRVRRGAGAGVAALLALSLLAGGCTTGGESAEDAAARLAAELTVGRLARVPFTGAGAPQAGQWWKQATAGMVGTRLAVTVTKVTESGNGHATARLRYTWRPRGTIAHWTWTYTTTATLTHTGDRWSPTFAPTLLAPSLKRGDRLELTSKVAPRADILGAHDAPLVTERPVFRFGIDRTRVPAAQAASSARRLAGLLGIDAAAYAKRVRSAGNQAFVEALVLRSGQVPGPVQRGYRAIPGAISVPDQMPLAPTHDFARPLLGTVGPVTADIVKKSNGTYRAGDDAGLSGLEQRYDGQLRGTPGVAVDAVSSKGKPRQLFSTRATAGKPLRTTLDPRLQGLAEKLLAHVGPASALVAIRPSDGNLLAVASGPGSLGYSTATLGRYAPGSTFKVISSLALLRAGLTTHSIMPCTPTTVVDGKSFKNYNDYPPSALGRIPMSSAVANSCNTAFVSQHGRVSGAQVTSAAAALGLGVDHDLGFPVFLGSVPPAASETEHAADIIGQGRVAASPLAMATVAASVGGGRTVVPRLLSAQQPHVPAPAHPLTGREAAALQGLMRGVVTSGSGVILAGLPGPPVLAKTGTAEFGSHQPPQTHAWMIAVHGDLAVAVFVDVGQTGSHTAGPILEQFLRGA